MKLNGNANGISLIILFKAILPMESFITNVQFRRPSSSSSSCDACGSIISTRTSPVFVSVNIGMGKKTFLQSSMDQNDKETDDDEILTTASTSSSSSMNVDVDVDVNEDSEDPSLVQETIIGGPSTMFAMARRMLVWDDQDYQLGRVLNDSSQLQEEQVNVQAQSQSQSQPQSQSNSTLSSSSSASSKPMTKKKTTVLPRWRPHEGIADSNPNFRTNSPIMNNRGYEKTIMRNARKNNKPSLWRHGYRTYVKMRDVELLQQMQALAPTTAAASKLKIKRENTHFQGALVACAKLGLWREAMFIYLEMLDIQEDMQLEENSSKYQLDTNSPVDSSTTTSASTTPKKRSRKPIIMDQYMILSIIRACIRGMKYRVQYGDDIEQRREPLDAAQSILRNMQEKHSLAPYAMQVNALASAYQYLGLYEEAMQLVFDYLEEPPSQAERERLRQLARDKQWNTAADFLTERNLVAFTGAGEKGDTGDGNDKDKDKENTVDAREYMDQASFSIVIQNSVTQGDWSSAIQNLKSMTEAGLYPKSKSLNTWSETATKRERRPKKPTWIKQREHILIKSTLYSGSGGGGSGRRGGGGMQDNASADESNS
jgi:hypothetical protein